MPCQTLRFSRKRTIRGILSRNLLLYRFEKDYSSGRFGENRRRSFLSSFSLKAGELPVHSPLYRRLCFQCHKIGNEPVGHSRRRRRNQPICFCLLPQIKSSGDSSLNNKKIGEWAFYGCPITSINLPEGLESLGSLAFWDCDLREVSIPSS